MRVEIREVDSERGLLQVTSPDSRWYAIVVGRKENGDPIYRYVPSVSWICSYYYKGEELFRWYGKHGYDQANEIKELAGEAGDKVHQGVKRLVSGGTVGMDDSFINPTTNEPEPLTDNEYWRLMTFREWFEKTRPEVLRTEYTVVNETHGYAGTFDWLARIGGKVTLGDHKTGNNVWPEVGLQLSALAHAEFILHPDGTEEPLPPVELLGALHLRPRSWALIPVGESEDCWEAFQAAQVITNWSRTVAPNVLGPRLKAVAA